MSTPGLALHNLRTVVIVIVLAVHAVLAYLGSSPASSFNFDDPPYRWRSIPIVDPERWFGFDIFCAFQDVYLISLLFFLSGLFVWPSLVRSGSRIFLRDRLLRIGVPFALTVGLLMPLAHYPVYRVTAVDPGWLRSGGIGWPCRSGPPGRPGSCGCCWCSISPRRYFTNSLRYPAKHLGDPLANWAPVRGNLSPSCCRPPPSAMFRWLLFLIPGIGSTSGRSRFSSAGRCTISSISSPALVPDASPADKAGRSTRG